MSIFRIGPHTRPVASRPPASDRSGARAEWTARVNSTLRTGLDTSSPSTACGELDVGVDDAMVWLACQRGAKMARRADKGEVLASDD